jgi:hypothetical protein
MGQLYNRQIGKAIWMALIVPTILVAFVATHIFLLSFGAFVACNLLLMVARLLVPIEAASTAAGVGSPNWRFP